MADVERFADTSLDPPVQGFLHHAEAAADVLVLTHGAGGNAQMPLLIAIAETFAGAGLSVLRCDLPFRQVRRFGPPRPADAERDRKGLENAVLAMKKFSPPRIFLGGQSYGGRQASMLCAGQRKLASGLLLLSYPLHPPGRPDQPRTQHLPQLQTPVMLVHGTHDPFGSIAEIEAAMKLIPSKTRLLTVDGTGHDLGFKVKARKEDLPGLILGEFQRFFR
ncbi:MAG TPA: alpha/beta family hydrolase [Terriglobales bacterium]|nr:alpha/beta family hydrolase [Terriglobales bacterium]